MSMYKENLVACIKVNGQILRESGSSVSLPFGCEYSILVKNLNSVRAQVSVSVDGKDAVGRIVIAPNSSVELERFVQNGNLEAGNRFKFIERTADIEKHRGIGSDDGLIRVEGWRERVEKFVDIPTPIPHYYPVYPPPYGWPPYRPHIWPPYRPHITWDTNTTGSGVSGSATGGNFVGNVSSSLGGQHTNSTPRSRSPLRSHVSAKGAVRSTGIGGSSLKGVPVQVSEQKLCSDAGFTVPGSESRQKFTLVSGFPLEPESTVIVLNLRGQIGKVPVVVPVTVAMKPKCETCGTKNKADSQYCAKCGTALVIYA